MKSKSGGFETFGLHYNLYRAIKKKGYNVPTPIQRKVIPLILSQHDVVACSKTGSGKTAAFSIPLINKLQSHSSIVGIRGLILLPTRELALQTLAVIKQFAKYTDLRIGLMMGGHGFEGQFESLAQNPDILIASPGRLLQHLEENRLKLSKVEMVIYDEADYLFEMGLADQLKQILTYLPPTRQSLMFSATIPEELSMFASVGLKEYVFAKLDSEYTLPETMKINFLIVSNEHKLSALMYLLTRVIAKNDNAIIFASTKYLVDLIVFTLEKYYLKCVHIYGKMDQIDRKHQLDDFRSNKIKFLIVTDLASRGIDIPFVNNVIHYDYPAKPKIFIHRSGRTARAGKQGTVYSLVSGEESFFINDTMLYTGRTLTNVGDLEDTSKAYYGSIPLECINLYQPAILQLSAEDAEFQKLQEISNRANQKFKKTRGNASKASIRKTFELNLKKFHPIFKEFIEEEAQNLLEAIKSYKPKQSYLEVKKIQNIKEQNHSDPFLQSLKHIKKIEQYQKNKRDQIKKRKQQLLESDSDMSEQNMEQEGEKEEEVKNQFPEENQDNNKKIKRSQIEGFQHPTQYIPNRPNNLKKSEFEDLKKIQVSDVQNYILAEDNEGLMKSKNVWDAKKRRFVRKNDQSEGKQKKGEKFDGNKVFKKWSKNNMMQIQKVGEREDMNVTNRAKEMFQRRQLSRKGWRFNDNENNAKSELKNTQQIMKSKKIKKNLKFKNMEKGKRRQIERKNRQKGKK